MSVPEKVWTYRAACEAVDVRDMDRSAWSGVPKRSGAGGFFSHHHRLLRSRGGDHSPANIVLLLGSGTTAEHGWVHAHPGEATVLGYMVPTGQDPAEVPIWRLDAFGMAYGWHLQTDDGQLERCDQPAHHLDHMIATALAAFEQLRIDSRVIAVKDL